MKHPAYENWLKHQAGEITLEKMYLLNNQLCLKSEVRVVKVSTPSGVQAAQKILGSPAEEGWENG